MEIPDPKEVGDTSPTDRQLLEAVYQEVIKTKRYMQWQFYITLGLVVVPIILAVIAVPFVLSSLGSAYQLVQ